MQCLKVPKGWVGVFRNFRKVPVVLYVTEKKEGGPKAILEKYHGTFLVIIMLKFVSNIRYYVKKSMKQNKSMVIRFFKDFGMSWILNLTQFGDIVIISIKMTENYPKIIAND